MLKLKKNGKYKQLDYGSFFQLLIDMIQENKTEIDKILNKEKS
jgi:hypothetical protein